MDSAAWWLECLLLYAAAPLWIVAGFADYLCHRVQRIERTSGVRESRLHLLLLAELGVGVLAALLLQVTAAALALMLAACIAHEATVWIDLRYADRTRVIPWFEQWIHGIQQALPWASFGGLAALHGDQAWGLLGVGAADWGLRWKDPPLPAGYLMGFATAALGFVLLPFLSEYRRCRAAAAHGLPLGTR